MTRLCVFCGSNAGSHPAFAATATRLGTTLAARGIGLVYGGGDVGMMGIVADAVLTAGGQVIGVIPDFLARAEVAHRGLTELRVVASMHERKALMAELADGFIVLPGGYGTVDELAEALTWTQLGLQAKPVVMLDVEGFFDALVQFFDHAVERGFVRPVHRQLLQRTTEVDDAIALATAPVPATPHKWLDRDAAP
jgi:uncharacterized protein (TIGR00730 family)